METLNNFDTQCFYWINHHNNNVLDWVMWVASQSWSWMIVLILFYALTTLRREPRRWWVVLLGIGLCFLLSDRLSVMCFKDVVCRLRPCHVLEDVNMFRTGCGGQYGFVSSHAANVFALAMFLSLRYSKRNMVRLNLPKLHSAAIAILLFAWALLVGYSRPYLGKHYPGDVLCGALLGLGVGALVFFLASKFESRFLMYHDTKES